MTEKHNSPFYFKILMAVVSVVLFVILSEIALRIADPELGFKNQFFPVNRDIDFPEFYEKDAKLFWKLRAGQTLESRWFSDLSYNINSRGLRGPEILESKSSFRLLALGNSCTFGWGVAYDNCWTRLLEQTLRKSRLNDAEIINAGIPGYSSHQGTILFEQLAPLDPDIVLIMFGWNDHWQAGKNISDAEQKSPPEIFIGLQNIFSRLRLYKLLRKATLNISEDTTFVRMDDISGKRRVSKEEFFDNLKSIAVVAKQKGMKPILLVPPIASLENYNLGTSSNLHLLHHIYQEQVIRVAEYLDIAFINLQEIFDQHNNLFSDPFGDPIHFNERGHVIVAETVAAILDSVVK